MAKTLLEVVQSTLSAINSDSVNTVGETIESEQVTLVAKEVFEEMSTYQTIPTFDTLTQLLGVSDTSRRTVMQLPLNATDIQYIRYKATYTNGTSRFEEVRYCPPNEFLDRQLDLRVGEANVGENVLPGNVRVPYRTDKRPEYWTTFDDKFLVFDAIDMDVQGDNTLHNDNSLVMAYIIPEFQMTDDFVIPLPDKLIPQYMNAIKEIVANEQKQVHFPVRERNGEREQHRNRWFAGVRDGTDKGFERQGYGRRLSGRSRGTNYRQGSSGLPKVR